MCSLVPEVCLAPVLDRMLAAGISLQQLRGGRQGPPACGDAQGPSTQRGARVPARSCTASLHESLMKRGGSQIVLLDAHNPAAQEHGEDEYGVQEMSRAEAENILNCVIVCIYCCEK